MESLRHLRLELVVNIRSVDILNELECEADVRRGLLKQRQQLMPIWDKDPINGHEERTVGGVCLVPGMLANPPLGVLQPVTEIIGIVITLHRVIVIRHKSQDAPAVVPSASEFSPSKGCIPKRTRPLGQPSGNWRCPAGSRVSANLVGTRAEPCPAWASSAWPCTSGTHHTVGWGCGARCADDDVYVRKLGGRSPRAWPGRLGQVLVGLDCCCLDVRDSLADQLPRRSSAVGPDGESRAVVEDDGQDIAVDVGGGVTRRRGCAGGGGGTRR